MMNMIFFKRLGAFRVYRPAIHISCLFALVLSVLVPLDSHAREVITMYLGEVQVMEIDDIERVAIGNPSVASNSILPHGQLVLLADAEGSTTMHIWLKNGKEREFDIVVNKRQVFDNYQELAMLLKDIPGTSVTQTGELIVVKGKIHKKDQTQYDRIMKKYGEVLDLVTSRDTRSEVAQLLEEIPNLSIREIGGFTVLSGELSEEYSKIIEVVERNYGNIMNLTRVQTAVAGKMVYMKVRIVEMAKSVSEQLGIKWDQVLSGPRFEFGVETSRNGATILNSKGVDQQALLKSGNANLNTAAGYFGITTGITSAINLLENTGDVVVLAEPQLSSRSGGKAEFHAGGEIAIPLLSADGNQVGVEYKKYGIMLHIEPTVDSAGNILAHIETEISTPDPSQIAQQQFGLLTRNTFTDVSLRENETLVIAGLVQEQAHKDFENVKWFADIPLLGALFKYKDHKNERRELMIFITPHIHDAASSITAQKLDREEKIHVELGRLVKGIELID